MCELLNVEWKNFILSELNVRLMTENNFTFLNIYHYLPNIII